jgi:glycosyltransferase involved in cell wall biosynthesis
MPSSSESRSESPSPTKSPRGRPAARPEILVFADYYLPGFKAGGPIRCLANIVNGLGDDFDFRVVTRDRDYGDSKPYSSIRQNTWRPSGKAKVLHLSPDHLSARTLRRVIAESSSRVVYLNSFFSPVFALQTLLLRWLGALPPISFIVAPRGEFSPSALKLKKTKKLLYVLLAKSLRLYKDVLWQASNETEEEDIRRCFGAAVRIAVVPDVSAPILPRTERTRVAKRAGQIKVAFASRISRIKNLHAALKMLTRLNGQIEFNIYGPLEDKSYWAACASIITTLPRNISVKYHGAIQHEQMGQVLSENHLFLLPTLGESYGHAIVEAMLAGCPVIISDQTPWRDLEAKRVGWDLPLTRTDLFENALQTCIDMDETTYSLRSASAQAYAMNIVDKNRGTELTRTLFEHALGYAQG